jgi:uncharacterized membrane protein
MKFRPLRYFLARSDQAGAFAAVGSVAGTFQRTLIPRSDRDQAIATGTSMALFYLIASLVQDGVESVATWALTVGRKGERIDEDELRRVSLVMGAGTFVGGLALQMAFPQRRSEPMRFAAARSLGFWLSTGSFAGLTASAGQELLAAVDRRSKHDRELRSLPMGVINGAAFAAVRQVQLRQRRALDTDNAYLEELSSSGPRSLAMGATIWAGLITVSQINRAFTRVLGRALDRYLPADERFWRPFTHVAWMGTISAATLVALHRVNQKIEEGAGRIEGAFESPPASSFVSGSAESHVPWETLSREGRRHVSTYVTSETIEDVMSEPAIDPIRVYVGLDSALSEEERIDLALREMERTGAFDRKLLVAASPTGTGYVNYVTIESAEYFSRGNCATVTLQYSKRPSPLSLDRVWEGRKHFRMLLAAIRRRLYKMAPEDRPRLVVFGESLGAHTSQDAFLHTGTQGLQDAGVERALWIGTPHLSKWAVQVLGTDRPDVERSAVGEFNSFDEVEALTEEQRKALRYVLITHGNDGVARFGFDLLIQQPDWLGEPETRPSGVPRAQKWVTPTTFVQTLIDMNNAMNVVPGRFDARGHDYRADLARFVREVFDLDATDAQLARVEEAMRAHEADRAARLQASGKDAAGRNGARAETTDAAAAS